MEADGYILRIASKEWVERVFDLAIYYTSTRRKWEACLLYTSDAADE